MKTAHTRPVDASAQVGEDENKAETELQDVQVRFSKAAREGKLSNERLEEARHQSVKSAKAVGEASCQLTELPSLAHALQTEISPL